MLSVDPECLYISQYSYISPIAYPPIIAGSTVVQDAMSFEWRVFRGNGTVKFNICPSGLILCVVKLEAHFAAVCDMDL